MLRLSTHTLSIRERGQGAAGGCGMASSSCIVTLFMFLSGMETGQFAADRGRSSDVLALLGRGYGSLQTALEHRTWDDVVPQVRRPLRHAARPKTRRLH